MTQSIKKFLNDEEGLTMVEYAICGGLVGAGAIAAFQLLGTEVFRIINAIAVRLGIVQIA